MTVTIEEMKECYDWKCAWNEAIGGEYDSSVSKILDEIKIIIASDEGENDGEDWICLVEMKDGTFKKMFAGCDYTGWDCEAHGNIENYLTRKELCCKNTLTKKEQGRLASQLNALKIPLDW